VANSVQKTRAFGVNPKARQEHTHLAGLELLIEAGFANLLKSGWCSGLKPGL
jgi:hypothetical protein